jgi:O-antigen/teichoic acid export membrane protein
MTMTLTRRVSAALPQGTALVGGGTAVMGLASYVHLSAANHALNADSDATAAFSLLWTMVFSIGIGLFFPVEQEITRVVAARKVAGDGARPALVRGAMLSGSILCATLVPMAIFARPLADLLFDGDTSLVFALAGAFAALSCAHVTRGALAGLGLFRAYGTQLALDGVMRMVFSVALALAGVHSTLAFAMILTVSPLLSVACTVRPALVEARSGSPVAWREMSRKLGMLVGSTLLAQLLVNIAVISTKVISTNDTELVTALLAALVLARVPLFVFGAFQVSLLRGLSTSAASGDRRGYYRLLLKAVVVTGSLGAAGGLGAVVLGPTLLPALFGAPDLLTAADFAWLSFGTVAYMIAMVLGQALLTSGGARQQLISWVIGTAALIGVTASPMDLRSRVEIAYAVGSVVVVACMAVALRSRVTYLAVNS